MNESIQTDSESNLPEDSDLKALDEVIKKLPQVVEIRIELGKIFSSIHQKMNKGLNYDEILESLFTSLETIIPFDRIGVALVENEAHLRLHWVKSKLPITNLKKDFVGEITGSGLQNILSTRRPRIINDLEVYLKDHPNSKFTRLALQDGVRSSLTSPLIINDKAIGVVFFSSASPFTYQNSHIELFTEISNGLAVIVEQAILKKSMSDITSKEQIYRSSIHDLRNPLNVIVGTLALLEKRDWYYELDPDIKKKLGVLKRNSEAMTNLLHDLVLMIEAQRGRRSLNIKSIALDEFLNEVFNDAIAIGDKKGIKIVLVKSPNLPSYASFDPQKMKEALENYISNAVKYSPENTEVIIEVKLNEAENRLCFIVTDKGQGIPEVELNKLFKEFGKTSVRPTSGELSTGLGLSIVKAIVAAHHGDVWVKSKYNEGSSFGLWIPIVTIH